MMVASVTNNPLIRVLDIRGVEFSGPPAPMPPIPGSSYGKLRSTEEIAYEKGFNGTSDMQCRMAELDLGTYSRLSVFNHWYFTDGSKGGLEALIKSHNPPIGPPPMGPEPV